MAARLANAAFAAVLENPSMQTQREAVRFTATVAAIISVVIAVFGLQSTLAALVTGNVLITLWFALHTITWCDLAIMAHNVAQLATKSAQFHGCLNILQGIVERMSISKFEFNVLKPYLLSNTLLVEPLCNYCFH